MIKKIFIIIICGLLMTSCSNTVELEDRAMVLAMAIDSEDGKLCISYTFPDMATLTGTGEQNVEKLVRTITGSSLYEIEKEYNTMSSKHLDYGQMQAVIFGDTLLKNPQQLKSVLNYFKENSNFSRTILAFAAESDAIDITALDEKVRGSIGTYLDEMNVNNIRTDEKSEITVGTLIDNINFTRQIISLPLLKIKDDLPYLSGNTVMEGIRYVTHISEADSIYTALSNGGGVGRFLSIEKNGKRYMVEFKKVKTSYQFSEKQNQLQLEISIKGEANIQLTTSEYTRTMKNDHLQSIQLELNQRISEKTLSILTNLSSNYKIDYTNSNEKLGNKKRKLWIKYAKDNPDYIRYLKLFIVSDIRILEY